MSGTIDPYLCPHSEPFGLRLLGEIPIYVSTWQIHCMYDRMDGPERGVLVDEAPYGAFAGAISTTPADFFHAHGR